MTNSGFLSITSKAMEKKRKIKRIYSFLTIEKNLTSFLQTSKTKAPVVLTHGDGFQKKNQKVMNSGE